MRSTDAEGCPGCILSSVKATVMGMVVGLLMGLGCSGASAPPGAAGAIPAMPVSGGRERLTLPERIESDVELMGLPMGKMLLDSCPAESRITTTIEASSLVRLVRRLSGTATTVLSPDSLIPERSSVVVNDGDDVRTYRVEYTGGGFDYEYEPAKGKVERGRKEGAGGAPIYDLQSSMALLRTWRPRLGEAAHFYVVLGRNLWRAEANFVGPEMLTVSGAPRLTRRVDGVAYRVAAQGSAPDSAANDVRRAFSLWFEHDGAGYPVRLVARSGYGDVIMSLARYVQSDKFCLAHREADAASAAPEPGVSESPSTAR